MYDTTHQPWALCDPGAHQPWALCDPHAPHPHPCPRPHPHLSPFTPHTSPSPTPTPSRPPSHPHPHPLLSLTLMSEGRLPRRARRRGARGSRRTDAAGLGRLAPLAKNKPLQPSGRGVGAFLAYGKDRAAIEPPAGRALRRRGPVWPEGRGGSRRSGRRWPRRSQMASEIAGGARREDVAAAACRLEREQLNA